MITAVVIGTRYGGKKAGFWTGALFCAVPGIMNMAVSAKSDSITLMCQLIIYDMLCLAVTRKDGEKMSAQIVHRRSGKSCNRSDRNRAVV